ncbi:glycosyltransferase family 4 protein [Desulfobulbus alkaliphilus]|uniref:glycosyltransferase family 4 protein n=1 Tax=Desulfobulbus alkaliphilus TaxID=869814 RepID=UPI0030840BAC
MVTTLSQTAQTLQSWGHEVLLITPDRFKTLPCPTYPEIRLSLVVPATIRKILDDFDPHAVHIATEGPIGWMTRSACRQRDFAFTTSYHTRFPEYVRMRAPVPLPMSYAVIRGFHRAARRTMAAPTILDELESKAFTNLVSWSRGVDIDLFRPRAWLGDAISRPLFLYVGRVAVEKNLPAFLDLNLPGTKWVIGDGPALESLRRAYPEVHFTGAKQGVDLATHIAAADVFVFPSRTDTFGIVLLEAMACGVPVAAFPVTGPKYIVREGSNGCLDIDLGAAALRALAVSRQQCRDYATNHSWESCTRQFLDNLAVNA